MRFKYPGKFFLLLLVAFVLQLFLFKSVASASEYNPYGINAHIPTSSELDKVQQAGIGWIRADFNWDLIQPSSQSSYSWSQFDSLVSNANSRGIEIFATLAYTPSWANGGYSDHAYPPTDAQDWYDFVYAVVSRYKDSIRYWGMWNEPNSSSFWRGTQSQYINDIVINGSNAVKAADPYGRVVGPDLASGQSNWTSWLATILDQAGDEIDVVSHRMYQRDVGDDVSDMLYYLDGSSSSSVWAIMKAHGAQDKEFWLTEIGWSTYEVSEQEQAQYYLEILDAMIVRPWWTKTFFFVLKDCELCTSWDPYEKQLGILNDDNSAKPAYTSYKNFISLNSYAFPSDLGSGRTYEAENSGYCATYHNCGRSDRSGWACDYNLDTSPNDLCYGPYVDDIVGGKHRATFRLMTDNNTANSDVVATINVFDPTRLKTLASRDIRRNEFTSTLAYQDFTLDFESLSTYDLEFRTYWPRRAYIAKDKVTITDRDNIQPDFWVYDVVGPASANSGSTVSEQVTLNKYGGKISSGSYVTVNVYLSTNDTISTNDTLLCSSTSDFSVSTLNSSGTFTKTLSCTLPSNSGNYYIGAIVDPSGSYSEFNENNNSTLGHAITLNATPTYPNLTPYRPATWSDKIVVSTTTGTNTDSSALKDTDTLYVDWAVANDGDASTTTTFNSYLYIDGVLKQIGSTPSPLNPTGYAYIQDYSPGSLSAGSHTLEIVADATSVIPESNESDNRYTKTINVESTTYTLLVSTSGSGTVTSNDSKINCGLTCSATYTSGSVTLTASPSSGWTFVGWGGNCSGTGSCSLTMNGNKSVTATFQEQAPQTYTLSVSKSGTGDGTITSYPSGISCGSGCPSASTTFSSGQSVTLTASADSNSRFVSWSGDSDCSDGSVAMNGNRSCAATFNTRPSISFNEEISSGGTVSAKVSHIQELRNAINLVRVSYGLSTWSDEQFGGAITTGGAVAAVHFTKMQAALKEINSGLSFSSIGSGSRIDAQHINELRQAVLNLQ